MASFKQGDLGINAYISQWLSYYTKAKLGDITGVWNFENGIKKDISVELFKGERKATVDETLMKIQEISQQIESLNVFS